MKVLLSESHRNPITYKMSDDDDGKSDEYMFSDHSPRFCFLRNSYPVTEDGQDGQPPAHADEDRQRELEEKNGYHESEGKDELRQKGRASRYPYLLFAMNVF